MLIETGSQTRPEAMARPRTLLTAATWQRAALAVVLLIAAVLNFWQLNRVGYGNTYYAAAVKSMLQNWHAFFFNSFDSLGFVNIDKPPLGFWLQAASAKLFGFSGLSLMLPQALAGVFSVALLYVLVRRIFGAVAGLLAALALAIMPVSVAASRNNIIDGLLVLVVLAAAWAVTRAVETGRLRWLLLCAILVGLGFNIKMLEAYLVVPAFGLVYLLGAPVRWWARIGHLAVAAVVLLAISLSWVSAVDLTPASARPYAGSSGTNSELNLALGYNGLNRLTGNIFGGGRRGGNSGVQRASAANAPSVSRATLGGFTRGETGNPGPLRLFNAALGGQVSWLLPLALLGLVVAGLQTRRRFPLDRRGQALVLWGAWLLTQAIFFSVAGFFHTYYMVMLAPSIAALAGIGLVALWQDYRRAGRRGWLLPLALVGTAAIQAYLLSPYPEWSRWLTPLVAGICVVVAGLLALARLGARLSLPTVRGAMIAGMLALLAAPAAWAAATVGGGGGLTPSAGPVPQAGRPNGFAPQTGRTNGLARYFGAGRRGGGEQTAADAQLVRYLQANQGATRYLFATLNATSAAPFILATGKPVMALGGFSGSDRIVTPDQLAKLVANGTVRFFLLPSTQAFNPENLPPQVRGFLRRGGGPRGGFGGSGLNGDLTQWVSVHCTAVPPARWQTPSTQPGGTPGFGFGGFGRGGGQQLYDCAGQAAAHAPSHNGGTAALDWGSLAMSLIAPASRAIS